MTTPAEYRAFALDCMRDAEGADDATMRLTIVGLARVWMRVALESERVNLPEDEDARTWKVP